MIEQPEQTTGGPFKLYIFDQNGMYDRDHVVRFNHVEQLLRDHFTEIRLAIEANREVMIEDGDGYAVFHAHLGRIIFPVMSLDSEVTI